MDPVLNKEHVFSFIRCESCHTGENSIPQWYESYNNIMQNKINMAFMASLKTETILSNKIPLTNLPQYKWT